MSLLLPSLKKRWGMADDEIDTRWAREMRVSGEIFPLLSTCTYEYDVSQLYASTVLLL